MQYENAFCTGREIEHSKLTVFATEPQFRNGRGNGGHSPREWHARLLTHLKQEEGLTEPVANLSRERPDGIAGLRMKYNQPHKSECIKTGTPIPPPRHSPTVGKPETESEALAT